MSTVIVVVTSKWKSTEDGLAAKKKSSLTARWSMANHFISRFDAHSPGSLVLVAYVLDIISTVCIRNFSAGELLIYAATSA
eukprot:1362311-Amorphochlora_amoeboformis.AAC.3